MARIHGRNGRLYANLTSAGTPEPITFVTKFQLDSASDRVDVTALGDPNKVYVAGLPDSKGTYTGWYDDASAQLYTASTDGIARKFYFYPSLSTVTTYWIGTAFFDFSITTGVEEAVAINGTWSAAGAVSKVG